VRGRQILLGVTKEMMEEKEIKIAIDKGLLVAVDENKNIQPPKKKIKRKESSDIIKKFREMTEAKNDKKVK
jgi:hypothetical protein